MSARDFFVSLPWSGLAVRPVAKKLAARNYLAAMFSSEGRLALRSSIVDDLDHIKGAPPPVVAHLPPPSSPTHINGQHSFAGRRWFFVVRSRLGAEWIDDPHPFAGQQARGI